MAVVGELVQAGVRHEDGGSRTRRNLVQHLARRPQRPLQDPVLGVGLRAGRVLDRRDSEQHDAAEPRVPCGPHRVHQGLLRVLHLPRHARQRRGLGQPLLDEERQHQVGRVQPGLRDQAAHARCGTQATRSVHDPGTAHIVPTLLFGSVELSDGQVTRVT